MTDLGLFRRILRRRLWPAAQRLNRYPMSVATVGTAAAAKRVMINLRSNESSTFTRQQVRDLIEQIEEASEDGAKVVLS